MRINVRTGWFLSVMALSTLVACGSSVDQPDDNGTGNGGSGGSGGGEQAGGPTAEQACQDVCDQRATGDCDRGEVDCAELCGVIVEMAGPECEDKVSAAFTCMLPTAASCDEPDECEDQIDAAEAYIEEYGCGGMECSLSGGADGATCECVSTCKGKKHEQRCDIPPDGTAATCACLVDGVEVGTCEATTGEEACFGTTGCCQKYFDAP